MQQRLQKCMSEAGVASRRAAEAMISAGRVTVNGQIAQLGAQADPETDVIRHYDVTGKYCPKYYVENEDAWAALKADVSDQMAQDQAAES